MSAAKNASAFLLLVASAFLSLAVLYYETRSKTNKKEHHVDESVLAVAEVALRGT